MRNFIIVGHRAVTTPLFSLSDLAGSAGRMDILARAINSAFFLSHDIRRDVEVALVLLGPEDPPKSIRLIGQEVKYLNPDERSTGALIRNALIKHSRFKLDHVDKMCEGGKDKLNNNILNEELRTSPGIYISDTNLEGILQYYSTRSKLLYPHESSPDISKVKLKGDLTFVLSDDKDFTEPEVQLIEGLKPTKFSLGPCILHTDHCMIIIHNFLDRLK